MDEGEWSREEVARCSSSSHRHRSEPSLSHHSVEEEDAVVEVCKWKCIPDGDDWKPFDKHYALARYISAPQAEFLRSLPLILHIPRLHTFLVHAGLVPMDLSRGVYEDGQPLAWVPHSGEGYENEDKMRRIQEGRVLMDVPENKKPWNVLNLRSILDDLSLSKYVFVPSSSPKWIGSLLSEKMTRAGPGQCFGTP